MQELFETLGDPVGLFAGATLGGVAFTGIETGIIVGMTTFVNWSMVSIAFEGGVLIGSILKGLICQ